MIASTMPDPPAHLTDDPERMRCPVCGCGHHRTIETRHVAQMVRRVRCCRHCNTTFSTYEKRPEIIQRD